MHFNFCNWMFGANGDSSGCNVVKEIGDMTMQMYISVIGNIVFVPAFFRCWLSMSHNKAVV